MRAARALAAGICALLCGCGASTEVTRGGGATIEQAQQALAVGGNARIAVGAVIDKKRGGFKRSLAHQLMLVNGARTGGEPLKPDAVIGGIRDMLVTDLFTSDRFVVLERESLDAVMAEQEFSQSASAGDRTRIPQKQLEGAELIVLGALTAFDAGKEGGAIPIPIPIGRGNFTIFDLGIKRGYAAMDLRVIDARSGRIVSSVAVEGKNTHFGVKLSGFFGGNEGYIHLPGVLNYFQNTPVEEALQKMVAAAVGEISKTAPLAH